MKLTRRDALAALAATGVTIGVGMAAHRWDSVRGEASEDVRLTDREAETLVAVATVVYPSSLTGIPDFVETYTVGRTTDRPAYARGVKRAIKTLDEYARDWNDGPFVTLQQETREQLLREIGIPVSDSDPDGSDPARLRYYLVNELLYALYTSPTGGALVGIENPQGHPGGLDSYRRGPDL